MHVLQVGDKRESFLGRVPFGQSASRLQRSPCVPVRAETALDDDRSSFERVLDRPGLEAVDEQAVVRPFLVDPSTLRSQRVFRVDDGR
jgi:hypothetical protein